MVFEHLHAHIQIHHIVPIPGRFPCYYKFLKLLENSIYYRRQNFQSSQIPE